LADVASVVAGSVVRLGAQDCHAAASGAFTGDVAAPMLADAGCSAVIVGHSERRHFHGETSAQVHDKAVAAAAAGLMAIVCVGETEAQRDAGHAEDLVCRQVAESLPPGFAGVVAYEPIWAIGTGRTPTQDDVASMHAAIRRALLRHLGAAGAGVRILYGGSVNAANAADLLAVPDVGGALVGGASLAADSFLRIAACARRG
jgi:triosephosphate isomerase